MSRYFTILLAFGLVQLCLIGWLDYITSYEVSVAILYYFPIAYAAWYLGGKWSFCFACLCAGTLTWADLSSGHHYSKEWMIWEVTAMRIFGFSFVAFSFNFFKRTIESEREKVRRLEGLLTFCNCCSRVQDDVGSWTDFSTMVRESSALQKRAKLCPECSRAAYSGVGTERASKAAGFTNRLD